MRLYLDDVRKPPVGWTLVKTADQCISMLESGIVEQLSLDHDLAEEHYVEENWKFIDDNGYTGPLDRKNYREKTGYAVVEWMIENNVWPKLVIVHSMNPVGRANMLSAIRTHAPDDTVVEERIGWCRR